MSFWSHQSTVFWSESAYSCQWTRWPSSQYVGFGLARIESSWASVWLRIDWICSMSVIIFDPYAKADEHDLPSDFRDAVANFKLNYKIRPLQIQNVREIVGDLIAGAAIFETKRVVKHIMRVQNYFG